MARRRLSTPPMDLQDRIGHPRKPISFEIDWPAGPLTGRASPFRNGRHPKLKSAPFGAYEDSLEPYEGLYYERLIYLSVRAIGGLVLVDVAGTRHPLNATPLDHGRFGRSRHLNGRSYHGMSLVNLNHTSRKSLTRVCHHSQWPTPQPPLEHPERTSTRYGMFKSGTYDYQYDFLR